MGDDAAQYRAEWSTRADRAPSDVYVPAALREAADKTPENGAVLYGMHRGRRYVLRLTDVSSTFPGMVSGRIVGIEEVPRG